MWEAITSNQRRSWLLIGLMGVLLVALGAILGALIVESFAGRSVSRFGYARPSADPLTGGFYGAAVALVVWMIMWLVARSGGDSILLASAGAHQIEKQHAPQLWNIVEEMTIASGLGQMPKIYIIDDDAPNAFAVGHRPDRAAVAVTAGLLRRLNRDELQGVIAHELGHVRNLDIRFMTLAAVMVGAIVLIADLFLRSLWYGGGRRRSSGRGGGQAQLILLAIAVVLAILAPLCAQLLYFACSRRREYLADASAARFTRYPAGLASALRKLAHSAGGLQHVNRVVAPLYIVNPLEARAALTLFATHPPIEKRIKVLMGMGDRAGLADYEAAFRQVEGQRSHCVGARTLSADASVAARAPTADADARDQAVERARQVGDLLTGLANFTFIPCACGLRIKLPPNFKRPSVTCPRCGRPHNVPTAAPATTTAPSGASRPAMRYTRKGAGWESFKCTCGQTVQLSPAFAASTTSCPKCNQRIEIVAAGE